VSPDRVLAGSEGVLGVITEAWVRVQPRPVHKRSAGVRFGSFHSGAECVRALSQSGLNPANCRLIDAREARTTMAGDGSHALLVLGFESVDHPVDASMSRALEICAEHGGDARQQGGAARQHGGTARQHGRAAREHGDRGSSDAVSAWREAFLGAPYMRDVLVAMGVLSETFETAITWERFPGFHERVSTAAKRALQEACPGGGAESQLSCRFTHVYPDGPAVYYTVLAPARRGEEVEQWQAIKRAVSDVVISEGGTITHHHAVGREHRRWYEKQRPAPFAAALRGAKAAVDPGGIMNPGVLIDPAS
jgi:alkyldihydroxyacetonephosphate synthase